VLDLHQASQLFRNSAHVLAQLRGAANAVPTAVLENYRQEMQAYARAMVLSARQRSDQLTREYQAAVLRVVEASHVSAYRVVAWLAFSLLAAWLIARIFLGRHVIARLQQVSRSLREAGERGDSPARVPVEGDDEICAMARAVEQFLSDRRQLATTRASKRNSNAWPRSSTTPPTASSCCRAAGCVSSTMRRSACSACTARRPPASRENC
jgi:methyl-accepting chemotaxis protein